MIVLEVSQMPEKHNVLINSYLTYVQRHKSSFISSEFRNQKSR